MIRSSSVGATTRNFRGRNNGTVALNSSTSKNFAHRRSISKAFFESEQRNQLEQRLSVFGSYSTDGQQEMMKKNPSTSSPRNHSSHFGKTVRRLPKERRMPILLFSRNPLDKISPVSSSSSSSSSSLSTSFPSGLEKLTDQCCDLEAGTQILKMDRSMLSSKASGLPRIQTNIFGRKVGEESRRKKKEEDGMMVN